MSPCYQQGQGQGVRTVLTRPRPCKAKDFQNVLKDRSRPRPRPRPRTNITDDIYCVRNIIESFINNCSTVTVCALDLSNASDIMNHYVLLR